MLMIAISIVFSGRSTVSPSQDSYLFRSLTCKFENARNASFTLQNY